MISREFLQNVLRQVSQFILNNQGQSYCDDCIRRTLRIRRFDVPEKFMAANAKASGFVREWGTCVGCSQLRVTTKAVVGDPKTVPGRTYR